MTLRIGVLAVLALGCADECEQVLTAQADPVIGEFVYDNRCDRCHGSDGQGIAGPSLVERIGALTSCDIVETVRSGPEQMPAFPKDEIDTQDLADLIEFMTLEFQ